MPLVELATDFREHTYFSKAKPFTLPNAARVGQGDSCNLRVISQSSQSRQQVDHSGDPITSGHITPYYLNSDTDSSVSRLPGLADELSIPVGRDGQVQIEYLAENLTAGFVVHTQLAGLQTFQLVRKQCADSVRVQLLPTGRLEGQMVVADGIDLTRHHVEVYVTSDRSKSDRSKTAKPTPVKQTDIPAYGLAMTKANPDGTFLIPSIAEGTARIRVWNTGQSNGWFPKATGATITANETTEAKIPFQKGLRCFGRFVERDGGKPIGGVKISVAADQLVTDKAGRFESVTRPNGAYARVVSVPDGFVRPYEMYLNQQKPNGNQEFDFGEIRLSKAAPIRGTVVDEQQQPLANVMVSASWVQTGEVRTFTLKTDSAKTDKAGGFHFTHASGDVVVGLTARTSERATKSVTLLQPENEHDAVKLDLSPQHMAAATVRVVDTDEQPIKNATIQFRMASLSPEGQVYGQALATLAGQTELSVNDNGILTVPEKLLRSAKYSLVISAPGYLSRTTPNLKVAKTGDPVSLGEFKLQRVRTARGTVLDAQGKPVAGVTVRAPGPMDPRTQQAKGVSSKTNDDGRFELQGIHPDTALVTATKDGYQRSGATIQRDAADLAIGLFKNDETVTDAYRIAIPKRNREQRYQHVQALLKPLLKELRASRHFHAKAIDLLIPFDTDAALDEISRSKSADTRSKSLAKVGEIDDALADVETITNGYSRAYGRMAIADHVKDRQQKAEILSNALVDAKTVERPDRRAVIIANVAGKFGDIEMHDRAKAILSEWQEQAGQLAKNEWSGFARGYFAERLSRYDHKRAIELVDGLDKKLQGRHFGNIAHTLGDENPKVAEEIVNRGDEDRSISSYRIRVCYRMASVDLERAIAIADGIDPQRDYGNKAQAYGVMAMALKDKDAERSKQLLQRAFEIVAADVADHRQRYSFGTAVTLVRYAEDIAPDRLTDYFWTALGLYPVPGANSWLPDTAELDKIENVSQLVIVLALYGQSQELIDELMAPAFEYWDTADTSSRVLYRKNATFIAMALANPEKATAWNTKFFEAMKKEDRRLIPQPWVTIGRTLGGSRQQIGQHLSEDVFHHWVIGNYDL